MVLAGIRRQDSPDTNFPIWAVSSIRAKRPPLDVNVSSLASQCPVLLRRTWACCKIKTSQSLTRLQIGPLWWDRTLPTGSNRPEIIEPSGWTLVVSTRVATRTERSRDTTARSMHSSLLHLRSQKALLVSASDPSTGTISCLILIMYHTYIYVCIVEFDTLLYGPVRIASEYDYERK